MKKIFEKWWDKNTKYFSIINFKKSWKENGNRPRIYFHHNGGKKKNGDSCFDVSLIIGYTIFNYINFDLQNHNKITILSRKGAKIWKKKENGIASKTY